MENIVEKSDERPLTDPEVMLEVEKVRELRNIAARVHAVKSWHVDLLGRVKLLLEKRDSTRTDSGMALMGILIAEQYRRAKLHGEKMTSSFAEEDTAALKAFRNRGGKLPRFPTTLEQAVRLIVPDVHGEWEPLERIVLEALEMPQREPAILEDSCCSSAVERYRSAGGREALVKNKGDFALLASRLWPLWSQSEPSLVHKSKISRAQRRAAGAKGLPGRAAKRMMDALDAPEPNPTQSDFLRTLKQLHVGKLTKDNALELVKKNYKDATLKALEECLATYAEKLHS